MHRRGRHSALLVAIVATSAAVAVRTPNAGAQVSPGDQAAAPPRYDDLVTLFTAWRAFQQPKVVNGVPDYSPAAMAAQQRELATYRRRLVALDTTGWPTHAQVDYHIVRAEMNGLDFDHRVLRPWANNPSFYMTVFADQSDQPAREGPHAAGSVELWRYTFPLSASDAAEVRRGLQPIPELLAQARRNLVGNGRDLWARSTGDVHGQSDALTDLETRSGTNAPADLLAQVRRAKAATDSFATWLASRIPTKTGPSGVGVANYDWYLKNVQLVPYTWQDEVRIMERELARARSSLALAEQRNRGLPELVPVASEAEHAQRFAAAVDEYMAFLRDHDILTVTPWMGPALQAHVGGFSPGPREFFTEVDYRDPEVMRTHGYHWFDLARMANAPHTSPIRRGPLLYNIFDTRTEGHATGWEEMMLHAGMFDARPRTRELIYILLAQRAARALGDLRMHSNELTLEQAAQFASANTPRGWLRLDANTVRGEQHLYLQQPTYGTSYVIGKIEVERLMSDQAHELGDRFSIRQFMDAFDAVGLIPVMLVRWEMLGRLDEPVRRVLR
ncbi:MAG TPA: DUF885 family protein [Gemmatimonadaceae bacterium]|nr:DUF885 family protein [Gemmatimonadaceae bacterium]